MYIIKAEIAAHGTVLIWSDGHFTYIPDMTYGLAYGLAV